MNISSISDELNRWYEENCNNGNLAWSFLAKKSGVSVSQICKIAKGQVANPKYETERALFEAMFPENYVEVYEYLLEKYPRHNVALQGLLTKKRKRMPATGNELLKDRLTFRLFKFADAQCFKVSQLESEFGKSQVAPRIEALLAAEFVEIDSSGILSRSPKYEFTVNADLVSVAEEFHHAIEILASKKLVAQNSNTQIDQIFNRMTGMHDNYSEQALSELAADVNNFLNSMYTKYKDNKYRGPIPAFLNVATGRFDNK